LIFLNPKEHLEGNKVLLLIDNYDSFTFNLYQMIRGFDFEVKVYRNDALTLSEIASLAPEKIVLSPGPCTPVEAGICVELVRRFGEEIPILGVCLGHQCIGAAYGAEIEYAGEIVHGKTSLINHDSKGVFSGIPNPFSATRYHSLSVVPHTLPDSIKISATTDSGVIMGIRHASHPVEGIQFHPESILTTSGEMVLKNFLF